MDRNNSEKTNDNGKRKDADTFSAKSPSEIDINALLRKYLPEEYGGVSDDTDAVDDTVDDNDKKDGSVDKKAGKSADKDIKEDANTSVGAYKSTSAHVKPTVQMKYSLRTKSSSSEDEEKREGNAEAGDKSKLDAANKKSEALKTSFRDDDSTDEEIKEFEFVDTHVNVTDIPSDREAAGSDVNVVFNDSDGEGDEGDSPTEVFTAVGKADSSDLVKDLYKPDEEVFREAERDGDAHTADYIKKQGHQKIGDVEVEYGTFSTKDLEKTNVADAVSLKNIKGKAAFDEKSGTEGSDTRTTDASSSNSEGDESDFANFRTDEEIDEENLNIMLALGLEDELEKTVGIDTINKIQQKHQEELLARERLNKERAALEYEYTTRAQNREIIDAYKTTYRRAKNKLIYAAILTLILFVFENHTLFGIKFRGAFDSSVYPVVYIMAGLQLTLFIAAPAAVSLWDGFIGLFRGKPGPETLAAFAIILDIAYNTVIAVTANLGTVIRTYNLPAALSVLLLYIYERINLKREIYSFNVVSSKKRKFALYSLSMSQSKLEHDAFSDMMDEDDDAEDISVLKINSTDFVNDYFLRTNRHSGGRKFIGYIIPAIIAVAATFFAEATGGNDDVYNGITSAFIAAMTCLPASVFFMFSYPFYTAVEHAFREECTIIGESSVEEYADAAIISFDDTNVFPSTGVKVRNINIFGNNRIDKVLYNAASVFSAVGGPLADVFELATLEIGRSENVTLIRADAGILETQVDDIKITFGNIEALAAAGINIPSVLLENHVEPTEPGMCVMYMLQNGKFVARMTLQYLVDSDFEFILKQLDKSGLCIGIKTFDPNITEEFIDRQVKLKKYPVRVIHCHSLSDKTLEIDSIDSGLVSKGSAKSLLQTVALCEKVLHIRNTNTMIAIISVVVGLILASLSLLFSRIDLTSAGIALFQLVWIVPMYLVTKAYIK